MGCVCTKTSSKNKIEPSPDVFKEDRKTEFEMMTCIILVTQKQFEHLSEVSELQSTLFVIQGNCGRLQSISSYGSS